MNNDYHPDQPVSSPMFVKGTPTWVQDLITKAATKYNIPTMVLSALIKQESGFNPQAQSSVGAQGIAQFMPGTAKGMNVNPWDPESSINGAAQYLRNGLDKFGKIDLALAAYNAGSGAVKQYGGIPPYKETQNYVKNIMAMAGDPHQSAYGPAVDFMKELKDQFAKGLPNAQNAPPGGQGTTAPMPTTQNNFGGPNPAQPAQPSVDYTPPVNLGTPDQAMAPPPSSNFSITAQNIPQAPSFSNTGQGNSGGSYG